METNDDTIDIEEAKKLLEEKANATREKYTAMAQLGVQPDPYTLLSLRLDYLVAMLAPQLGEEWLVGFELGWYDTLMDIAEQWQSAEPKLIVSDKK